MSIIRVERDQRICALCRYWNGCIGSTTIQIVPGGTSFRIDNAEKRSCFKKGRGMAMPATQYCSYFVKRYED